jgi:single-strand DNA-binding protein
MNTIIVAGNLAKDAELRSMPDGKPVSSFAVADNTNPSVPAIFWNCAYISERAPNITQHLIKGTQVTVVGNVNFKEWVNKSGVPQKTATIYVREIALQGSKINSDGHAQAYQKPVPALNKPTPKAAVDFPDDDIPF